ncbi:MAG: ParA family protein [bacterium]|nr:ParA family protein [bacterium]
MKIAGLWSPKGGVGKTTLALNMAGSLIFNDSTLNVYIYDADPQGSTISLMELSSFPFKCIAGIPNKQNIPADADYIIVDYPPKFEAMPKPRRLVVSFQPSLIDTLAVSQGVDALNINEGERDITLVPYRVKKKGVLTRQAIDFVKEYGQEKIPVVLDREVYKQSFSEGKTVFQAKQFEGNSTWAAREEIRNINNIVFNLKEKE